MKTIKKFVESFEELQNLLKEDKDVYLQNAGPFGSGTAKVLFCRIGQPGPSEDQDENTLLDPNMEVVEFNKSLWQLNQDWADFESCASDLYYEIQEMEPGYIDAVKDAKDKLIGPLKDFIDAIKRLKDEADDSYVIVAGDYEADELYSAISNNFSIEINE